MTNQRSTDVRRSVWSAARRVCRSQDASEQADAVIA